MSIGYNYVYAFADEDYNEYKVSIKRYNFRARFYIYGDYMGIYIGIPKEKKYENIISGDRYFYVNIFNKNNYCKYVYIPGKSSLPSSFDKEKYFWITFGLRDLYMEYAFQLSQAYNSALQFKNIFYNHIIFTNLMTGESIKVPLPSNDEIKKDLLELLNILNEYYKNDYKYHEYKNEIEKINELI